MMQNKDRMQKKEMKFYANSEISLFDGETKIPTPQLQNLRKAILEKFSTMNLEDIENSGISQYEYRKIIGMKYQDIELSREDIGALSLYKHGVFGEINGFLRGDLSGIKMSEERFIKELPQIIDYIIRISRLQEQFVSDNDMTLVRTDKRINSEIDSKLEYDNFVSTTANDKVFLSGLDGIKQGGYIFINVPKGTPMIPMDIATEKKMSFLSQSSLLNGKGDIGYEESEILLPMCELRIDNHRQNQNGKTIANATIMKLKNPIEIIEARLEDMSELIVKYGGQEKLDELKSQVHELKSQNEKSSQFSEQEIGKSAVGISIENKDRTQHRVQRDWMVYNNLDKKDKDML